MSSKSYGPPLHAPDSLRRAFDCLSMTATRTGGLCCASGVLDECGVCDGDSSSCALQATVQVQVRALQPQIVATQQSQSSADMRLFLTQHARTAVNMLRPAASRLPQVLDASILFDLGAATVTATFAAFMGGLLGLQPSQIAVTDAVVTPGTAVSTSTSAYIPLQVRARWLPLSVAHCTDRFKRRHSGSRVLQSHI